MDVSTGTTTSNTMTSSILTLAAPAPTAAAPAVPVTLAVAAAEAEAGTLECNMNANAAGVGGCNSCGDQLPLSTESPPCWTARQTSLYQSSRYMFDNQDACDVHFKVGEEGTIGAHRYVLYSRSPIFCEFFCGKLGSAKGESIEVPNTTLDALTEILRYLYYEEARLCADNVVYMLHGARKFCIIPLAQKCVDFLNKAINVNDVFTVLEQSLRLTDNDENEELTTRCLTFIRENTDQVLDKPAFLVIRESTLILILHQSPLGASEAHVFLGCIEWARFHINPQKVAKTSHATGRQLRKTLKNILPLVRFNTMTLEEFAKIVVPFDVLTTEETLAVFKHLTGAVSPPSNPVQPGGAFSVIPRFRTKQLLFVIDGNCRELIPGPTEEVTPDAVAYNYPEIRSDGSTRYEFTVDVLITAPVNLVALEFLKSDSWPRYVVNEVAVVQGGTTLIRMAAPQVPPAGSPRGGKLFTPTWQPAPSRVSRTGLVLQEREAMFADGATGIVGRLAIDEDDRLTAIKVGHLYIRYSLDVIPPDLPQAVGESAGGQGSADWQGPVPVSPPLPQPLLSSTGAQDGVTCTTKGRIRQLFAIELRKYRKVLRYSDKRAI